MLNIVKATFDLNWLYDPTLQRLLSILSQNSEQARVVGGAVRNALLNKPIADIDIATSCTPQNTIKYAEQAGFKAIATGLAHGTITIVANHKTFEVTTLREDIETDGRHAKIKFTKNWELDAYRRDFTINALYIDAEGMIYDYVNGLNDIKNKQVIFIGEPAQRIQEDYLRILRFFRFYAYYGEGAPNKEALINCVAYKNGLAKISTERIWSELKKILIAPSTLRAILWMRKSGILDLIVPQSEKWGIDFLPNLIQAEQLFNWNINESPFLRLQAIIPPRTDSVKALAKFLKLSKKETKTLLNWAKVPVLEQNFLLNKFLYCYGKEALISSIKLLIAKNIDNSEAYLTILNNIYKCDVPIFPISGQDLINLGESANEDLGLKLKNLEKIWLANDCNLSKQRLLELFVKQQ